MDESTRAAFNAISQVLFWIGFLAQIGIVAAAFVRLKTTVSGLLVGGGFSLIVLVSLLAKIVRSVLPVEVRTGELVLVVSAASTMVQMCLMMVVAVGIALIPSSLAKLRDKG